MSPSAHWSLLHLCPSCPCEHSDVPQGPVQVSPSGPPPGRAGPSCSCTPTALSTLPPASPSRLKWNLGPSLRLLPAPREKAP